MNTTDDDPRCDKCGAQMTTSAMAWFCPLKRECAFWPNEPHLDDFIVSMRNDMEPLDPEVERKP